MKNYLSPFFVGHYLQNELFLRGLLCVVIRLESFIFLLMVTKNRFQKEDVFALHLNTKYAGFKNQPKYDSLPL